jgi:hypothetical protein
VSLHEAVSEPVQNNDTSNIEYTTATFTAAVDVCQVNSHVSVVVVYLLV